MNNNNINTCGWIGITHLDNIKFTSNILGQHIYINSINNSNYTSNASNILEQHIYTNSINNSNYTSNASNILNTNSSNFTNALRYDVNKWINEEYETSSTTPPITLTHTYIYSSNLLGEIRFFNTKAKANFPLEYIPGTPNYRVKIDVDGKLKLYYVYNPIINAVWFSGWIDPANIIVGLIADSTNQGVLITGLESQIAGVIEDINVIIPEIAVIQAQIADIEAQITAGNLTNNPSSVVEEGERISQFGSPASSIQEAQATQELQNINSTVVQSSRQHNITRIGQMGVQINQMIVQNPITSFAVGFGSTGIAIVYGIYQNLSIDNFLNRIVERNINSNIYLSLDKKRELLELNSNVLVASNLVDMATNFYKLGLVQGFLNSNIQTQQYIPNLKVDTLSLNSGNITAVNTINVNTINISGKVKQFGNYLDDTYLKPEDLYNLSYNYTTERRYPPKAYNTSTTEKTVNLLNTLVYNQTLFLDNIGITYGDGQYEIYSSSTYDNGITNKDKLFDFDNTQTINTPRWAINQYESGTGDYQGNSTIDGVDYGDFIIIKLPLPFLLTRFRFYKNTSFPQLAPSLWKCFGSSDGIEWFEIFQAHNFTRLTEANYNFGYYEKTLANTFTTLFNYIGFSFNSLTGTSGATSLNFSELQLFGKEQLSYNIDSYIYTTPEAVKVVVRDQMADVPKRRGFIVSIPNTATYYDATTNITYYKYDLDLRLYLTQQIIPNTTDPYRSFKFACWYTPSYFGSYINSQPYVISYTIFMSNKANAILGQPDTAGLNIYAVGFPENVRLANILPNNIMLLKNANNNFNYLTIVSRIAPCDINCIIEDQLF